MGGRGLTLMVIHVVLLLFTPCNQCSSVLCGQLRAEFWDAVDQESCCCQAASFWLVAGDVLLWALQTK